jgi:Xaa-Pro dipeptidase
MPKNNFFQERQSRLASALQNDRLDALVLNAGPSLTYFSGLHFHLSERPVVLFLLPGRDPIIVAPELEAGKIQALSYALDAFLYGEDTWSWPDAFRAAARAAGLSGVRVGVEPRRLRVLEMELLEPAAPGAFFISAQQTLASLRTFRTTEVAAMRQAVRTPSERWLLP